MYRTSNTFSLLEEEEGAKEFFFFSFFLFCFLSQIDSLMCFNQIINRECLSLLRFVYSEISFFSSSGIIKRVSESRGKKNEMHQCFCLKRERETEKMYMEKKGGNRQIVSSINIQMSRRVLLYFPEREKKKAKKTTKNDRWLNQKYIIEEIEKLIYYHNLHKSKDVWVRLSHLCDDSDWCLTWSRSNVWLQWWPCPIRAMDTEEREEFRSKNKEDSFRELFTS